MKMSKKNDDFFKEKKPWSQVKDQLLGCYFKPYVQKILHTRKPLVYVDCFAGKGKFEDGNPGSPLIALEIIDECLATTKMVDAEVSTTFIDLNYAKDLTENLKAYPNVNILSGKYEDLISNVLSNKRGKNIFLYIDPYGIKSLQCSAFDRFANAPFNSIELLINLNSFGFIREACHAMGTSLELDDPTLFDDLVEYDPSQMTASDKSLQELDEIAGGDYWRQIIESYKNDKINGYEAEELFAEQYCRRLSQNYAYVLNMPLRIKRGQRPKYRMIHVTNHPEGCLLMVDNICNRWETWKDVQTGGQLSLFEEDVNNQVIDETDIQRKVQDHFANYSEWISLYKSLSMFFMQYGPICKTGTIKDILKKLENDGRLVIKRDPPKTETGRTSKFMEEKTNKQTVLLRWAQ